MINFTLKELEALKTCIDVCCDMTCPVWDGDEELSNNVESASRKLEAYLNDENMSDSDIIPVY